MSYIEVHDLCKCFTVRKKREKGQFLREKTIVKALQNVSFTIDRGELVGYIGPNGPRIKYKQKAGFFPAFWIFLDKF